MNSEVSNGKDGVVTRYDMLPLTLGYALNELDKDRTLKLRAQQRLAKYHQKEDQTEEAFRQLGVRLEDIGATTPEGRLAALQAQLGFAAYQQGHYREATNMFEQARNTSPRLSFVYQLWALVEQQEGYNRAAEEHYRKAVELNPRHYVIWQQWANMKRTLRDNEGTIKVLSGA